MKIGVVYPRRGDRWPKMEWVCDGFVGHEVVHIQTVDQLKAADASCDAVIFEQRGAGLCIGDVCQAAAARKNKRCYWITWNFDLIALESGKPLAEQGTLQNFNSMAVWQPTANLMALRLMDIALVKEAAMLDEYRRLGVKAFWFDQGCPETMGAASLLDAPRWDVLVIGSKSRSWRQRFDDARFLLNQGFRVGWVGDQAGDALPEGFDSLPYVNPAKIPALVSLAGCVLGVEYRHDVPGFWSDRMWLVCGAGGVLLRRMVPQIPAGPYFVYHDEASLSGQVSSLLGDPRLRKEAGAKARQWVMGEHTYRHRCADLVELLESFRAQEEEASCSPRTQSAAHAEAAAA